MRTAMRTGMRTGMRTAMCAAMRTGMRTGMRTDMRHTHLRRLHSGDADDDLHEPAEVYRAQRRDTALQCSYGLYSYGLYSYGLYSCDL